MKRLVAGLLVAAVLVSCQTDTPDGVIPQGTMTDLLYDYHRASAMAESREGKLEEERYLLIHKVFEKYGVTEAQFDSSMVYYSGHAKNLVKMYEKIDGRLKRELADLGATLNNDVYANITSVGDTAMIWQTANLWLMNNARENLQIIHIQPDSTFRLGDTYMLRFSTRFVGNMARRDAYAMLTARFDNDSVSAQSARVSGDHETTLRIAESHLTDHNQLKQLTLTFYLGYDETEPMQLWMVGDPILVRFHKDMPIDEEAPADTTLQADSLEVQRDSLSMDSVAADTVRLTPQQMRNQHKGERSIDVVQKRRVVLPSNAARRKKTR